MLKVCTKCGTEKPLAMFPAHKSGRDGLASRCRVCVSASTAAWRSANPWRRRAADAVYYAANTGRKKATNAVRYDSNSERIKASTAAWKKANPESSRIYSHNRRARILEVGGNLSTGLADKLLKLQRGKCACCGEPLGDKPHLDHIMPLKLGGSNTDGNMQLLRAVCNLQKSTAHPVEFMQKRGFLL